jgi:hypothetical protein
MLFGITRQSIRRNGLVLRHSFQTVIRLIIRMSASETSQGGGGRGEASDCESKRAVRSDMKYCHVGLENLGSMTR